jgi:DsbC/DsbD-like thiol-disulfide interchange protein
MVQLFADEPGGGFFYTSRDHERLFARSKDQYDGVQPSGNSMAALNLVLLWQKTHERHYRDLAERTLRTFAGALEANPTALAAMARALALFQDAEQTSAAQVVARKQEPAQDASNKSDSKVEVTASLDPKTPGADGKQVVTITLAIESGWHIYANPADNEDVTATTVKVSARVRPRDVKVDYPEGKVVTDPTIGKYRVYEDRATIKATVLRAAGDSGPLEISVKFQACNEKSCLVPATKKLTVP